uniref:AlNc14C77G5126 protein n=1 Tax=Albugo laibachii Nc14 TaxID=890382 RepID=F0WES6_9STRA|nr:AlNc14C77G5126 [Albugo laibachii Nc14]|eukprot:CCA19708.1 AlNc14C77G5126 [Albugo laibachii Nc14]
MPSGEAQLIRYDCNQICCPKFSTNGLSYSGSGMHPQGVELPLFKLELTPIPSKNSHLCH